MFQCGTLLTQSLTLKIQEKPVYVNNNYGIETLLFIYIYILTH